jgi:hypothetical protein
MDAQLQQIIELQTQQNQLLEKYLWRIRFSLLTLLLLTTAICCGLGFLVYKQQLASSPRITIPSLSGSFTGAQSLPTYKFAQPYQSRMPVFVPPSTNGPTGSTANVPPYLDDSNPKTTPPIYWRPRK